MKPQLLKGRPTVRTDLGPLEASCSNCALRELCLPVGSSADRLKRVAPLVYARRKVSRDEDLYHAGNAFSAIYAVRSGFFKNDLVYQDGREQVIGFHMSGDILGMDGIGADCYTCNAVALEDSEVCVIPFSRLEDIACEERSLQHQFHRVMSREMVRNHDVMLLLGARAEVRLAAFLLDISQRVETRGYSASEFHLRMTREEIGSFLGLKLETISRLFSQFQRENLVAVLQRYIRILDAGGLRKVAATVEGAGPTTAGTGLSRTPPPVNGKPRRAASNASALCA